MLSAGKAWRNFAASAGAARSLSLFVLAFIVFMAFVQLAAAQQAPNSDIPPTAAAQIVKVTPDGVAAGSTATLQITGGNFSAGAYVSFSTPSVRVISTARQDGTRLSASVEINPSAQPGAVTLYVSNPAGPAAQTSFNILAAVKPPASPSTGATTTTPAAPSQPENAPQVNSVAPAKAGPGSRCTLKIKGKGFVDGASVSFSNPGVQVLAVRFQKSGEVDADVQIASEAATGATGLFVVNPDDSEVEYSFDISGDAVTMDIPAQPAATTTPAKPATQTTGTSTAHNETSQKFEVYNVGNAGSILHNPTQAKGTLTVSGGKLSYEEAGQEVFSASAAEIQEIGVNVIFGINTGTFHVILRGSKSYNFASATLRPADTESMVNSLRQALQMK